jgi:threonine synthase
VASGDTGGAVASGFLALRSRSNHSLSIRKVSNIQEKQLTLGQNIKALEVDGVLMIVRTWKSILIV